MKYRNWKKRIFFAAAGILIIVLSAVGEAKEGEKQMAASVFLQNAVFSGFIKEFVPRGFWTGMGGEKGQQVRRTGICLFADQMREKPDVYEADSGFEEIPEKIETESEDGIQQTDIIFVGDSRVVGMASAGGYHYVGEVGMGYYWLTGEGAGWFLNEMAAYPNAAVVFCFGINDLGNIGAYIDYYQMLLNEYPDRQIYFMSVNPVNEAAAAASGYTVNNAMIDSFNSSLMNSFPDRYIDVYSYLMAGGFGTGDGIHYDTGTYVSIQNYTLLMINAFQEFDF